MQVATVLGNVSPEDLGVTLTHEHVLNASPGVTTFWPELIGGRTEYIDRAVDLLRAAHEQSGIETIVDLTPVDFGRDITMLREVSSRSGMKIVACTGHHRQPSATTLVRTTDELADFFTREVTDGIDGTGIRAGIIKVASDREGVTDFEERVLRAAARTHVRTGVPITAHSYSPGRVGEQQVALLESEGVDLTRVCIAHCDDVDDPEYLESLAARGCYLGFDRFPGGPLGATFETDWDARYSLLLAGLRTGLGRSMLLSHDFSLGITVFETDRAEEYQRSYPDGLQFISRHVLPRLAADGVAEDEIRALLVDNPWAFLCGAGQGRSS